MLFVAWERGGQDLSCCFVLMVPNHVISWQEEGIVKAYACRLQKYAK